MNKIILLIAFILIITGCSFNKNSKFWTQTQNIPEEKKSDFKEMFSEKDSIEKELNTNLKINLGNIINKDFRIRDYYNNDGRLSYDGLLKKSSRYKFSKIKNFYQYEPTISFNKNNLIFFDNKGSIIRFSDNSKILWKKNFYNKKEKKINPVLNFSYQKNKLLVTDSLSKYYLVDITNGKLLWSKEHQSNFISQIKIDDDRFYVLDSNNSFICFSLSDGQEIWKFQTDKQLIKSQKKTSIIFDDKFVYFNNSKGEITVQPGVTFAEIFKISLLNNWTLSSCPGGLDITIGGSISNNVHKLTQCQV